MPPLMLFSGMGADDRLFRHQRERFGNLRLPGWIPPERGDDLPRYARRLAEHIDPGSPCFVGGVSLGGMIAIEAARHLDCLACFLIASIRSPGELPLRARVMKPVAFLLPPGAGGIPPLAAKFATLCAGRFLGPVSRSLLEQLADADRKFVRWASMAILKWRPHPESLNVPVRQIHGDRDHVLPHTLTTPDRIVHGGGHLLPMTHAEQVNQFLHESMVELGDCSPG